MSVITTGNTARMLQDGLNTIFGDEYKSHDMQWDKIFDVNSSKKAFEVDQQFEGFTLAPVKSEGESIAYDTQAEGFTPKYKNLTYGKGFIVTEEADESYFWLEFIIDEDMLTNTQVESLVQEANELTAIFTSSRKTARRNN